MRVGEGMSMKSITIMCVLFACLSLVGCGADGATDQGPGAGQDANQGDGGALPDGTTEPEGPVDPGTRTLQRLNRAEYNNTVRDLLGVAATPADDFPNDDRGYGFDNIGDVLSMSPLLFELYERAADELVEEAMHIPRTELLEQTIEAESATASVGGAHLDIGWNLWSNGDVTAPELIEVPETGEYRLTVLAWGQQAGPEVAQLVFLVDGAVVDTVAVDATGPFFVEYSTVVEIREGLRSYGVGFTNDYYDEASGGDRNLIVDSFSLKGPLNATPGENPLRDRIMTCDPAVDGEMECAREVLTSFGRRAWRRSLSEEEVTMMLGLVQLALDEGDVVDEGIKLAMKAMLVSPHFLFKVELDASPVDTTSHPLTGFELATRLSYFLWSSAPDDVLLDLAESGELSDAEILAGQVERMLDDPRAEALVQNFAGQWLHIRAIEDATPDVWYFPDWNDELKQDMLTEAQMNFRSILDGERSMQSLINGQQTFLNERLAAHYDVAGVQGEAFVSVDLSGTPRVGWLSQGGLLTATSYATRTSPVRRGQWVLANLLCREPPAPPAGVEGIPEENVEGATLRERMEIHRAKPECIVCHTEMDPIGFAFENFDGIGAWRDYDEGQLIDASGELPGGQTFNGSIGLASLLTEQETFATCVVEKTMTYAIGRGPQHTDDPYFEETAALLVASDYSFRDLIRAVVLSEPFGTRRGRTDDEE